ncbi:M23 family metallopeptidase [Marinifilum sp. D737]|uniref:M23 family metallopeptidase n=1 Tax=Marinifilum sp. D737 TaxID=2969628 RepID=UPI002275B340|nr:M23 family metallopeptidase [Marinifilum sp. D737]MCY1634740.1 M23 family metallopeptidase [Marinifilum sp. D737]
MKHIKTNIITFLSILFFLSPISLSAQQKNHPKNYFRSPVDFTITLSGNFAELRNNHFHSGIDIRTFTTGKKVYAIADGFVSRIKISAGGYGKAIYIDHPNGYTSVYAHLDGFNKKINDFVKAHQYSKNIFEFDLNFKKDRFPVKKGEVIAISGNTGSSAGPHLHFEIRDTKSEHPLNPLLFGFKIKDTTPPKIFNLYVYPMDSLSSVNGKNTRQKFPVTYYNNTYHLKGDPKVILSGNIGFGVQVNDYLDNTWGKCGIYNMKVKVNDSLISNYTFKEFSFDESRYINSHMDYALNIKEKRRIHKCFKEPNNKLSIYNHFSNRGIYNFKEGTKYKIDFLAYDTKNNLAKLRMYAQAKNPSQAFNQSDFNQLLSSTDENTFKKDELELKFPSNSFYSDIKFKYSKKSDSTYLSDIHSIHEKTTPVHKYYTIAIKPNRTFKNENKLFIATIEKPGKISNVGGVYINGWVKSKTRVFGDFAIVQDTISPIIKSRTNFKLKNLSVRDKISFTIKDELSGIKNYKGTIDGKWVLFEFDAKNNHLFYKFDKKRLLPNRKHDLNLEVTDKLGNKTKFQTNFFW